MLWWTLRKLKKGNWPERCAAVGKLAELNTRKANKALLNVLNDREALGLRMAAVKAIGNSHNYNFMDSLIALSRDKNSDMRACALIALSDMGKTTHHDIVMASFIAALKDGSSTVRESAAWLLGRSGDLQALEPLVPLLSDRAQPNRGIYGVQKAASKSLVQLVSDQRSSKEVRAIVPSLITLLLENDFAKYAALEVLSNIDDSRAFRAFLFKECFVGNTLERYVERMSSLMPVGEYARDALEDENEKIREKAVEVLAILGDPKAIASLLEDENKFRREKAVKALGCLGEVEPLIRALEDEDGDVRAKAAEALGTLGDPKAVDPLLRALRSEEGTIQCAVALGKIGDKETIFAVMDYLVPEHAQPMWHDEGMIAAFRPLFGDYTHLVLGAGRYFESRKRVGISDPVTNYSYVLNMDVVKEICEIESPISTFLLNKLARIRDVQLIEEEHALGDRYITLNCEPMRKLAQDELKRRGIEPNE